MFVHEGRRLWPLHVVRLQSGDLEASILNKSLNR
jgi:hypothetical protein